MGPWLVLVSPCFRENVVATCKLGSFWCSLDNLLQTKRNCFLFLEIKFQNGAHLRKKGYFVHFSVTREKLEKFLQHISHSRTYTYFALRIDFFALPIKKKYQVWFLFGLIPGVDSYSRHFRTINE